MLINRENSLHPHLVCALIHGIEPVRGSLIGAKDTEVCLLQIALHHIAQEGAQDLGGFGVVRAWLGYRNRVVAEVRHQEVF